MALIELDNFGIVQDRGLVFSGLSLKLGRGQRLALLVTRRRMAGLILKAIAGLLPDNASASGSIGFDGTPFPRKDAGLAALRTRLGCFDADLVAALPAGRLVSDIVASALELRGRAAGQTIGSLLTEAGLGIDIAPRRVMELQPEQRRRVAIAALLAGSPQALVVDETSFSGATDRRSLLELLRHIPTARGIALLIMTDDLRAATLICDEAIVADSTGAVDAGPLSALVHQPGPAQTRALLAGARELMPRSAADASFAVLSAEGVVLDVPAPRTSPFAARELRRVLDGAGFVLHEGEALALVGADGAGHRELAQIACGMLRADAGRLVLLGASHDGAVPALLRPDVGVLFKELHDSFDPRLSVGASVALPLQLESQLLVEEQANRLIGMIKAVGLPTEVLDQLPGNVPVAALQRLALVRALIGGAKILVLDEPMAPLTPPDRLGFASVLNRLRAELALSLLIVSSDLEAVVPIADRALVLDRGKVVEAGRPTDLLATPQHEATQRLVASRLPPLRPTG